MSSVPHDGSVTSMVGSVGGGIWVLARVSALGRSQNKLKLHVLPSFDVLHTYGCKYGHTLDWM